MTWQEKLLVGSLLLAVWYFTFGMVALGVGRIADELRALNKTLKDIYEEMP
jgi:hypothetical protein